MHHLGRQFKKCQHKTLVLEKLANRAKKSSSSLTQCSKDVAIISTMLGSVEKEKKTVANCLIVAQQRLLTAAFNLFQSITLGDEIETEEGMSVLNDDSNFALGGIIYNLECILENLMLCNKDKVQPIWDEFKSVTKTCVMCTYDKEKFSKVQSDAIDLINDWLVNRIK